MKKLWEFSRDEIIRHCKGMSLRFINHKYHKDYISDDMKQSTAQDVLPMSDGYPWTLSPNLEKFLDPKDLRAVEEKLNNINSNTSRLGLIKLGNNAKR